MKKFVIRISLLIIFDVAMIYIFRLHFCAILGLGIVTSVCFPFLGRAMKKRTLYQREYYEVSVFMEQFLCSYKRWGHVKMALEDCSSVFSKTNKIAGVIQQSIEVMESGDEGKESTILKNAFNCFTDVYKSRRVRMLCDFLCHTENAGGDVMCAVDILLNDLQMWKQRTVLYQKKKKYLEKELLVSSFLAVFLCCITQNILPHDCMANIEKITIYQVTTFVMLSGVLVLPVVIYCVFSQTWLDIRGKNKNSIENEFPYWLLLVSLYLQYNSVYHAIEQSCDSLEKSFQREVEQLLQDLYAEPNSLNPYMNFCRKQANMELQTGMKILFSVTNNEYSDTKRQMQFLVQQNHRFIDEKEKKYDQAKLAVFQMFKQLPMFMAGAKIITDALLFVLLNVKNSWIG